MSVYDDVKHALQDFLTRDICEIQGELKAVNTRLEALDQRFDDLIERLELRRRIENLERERDITKAI